jgi:hypothetical protein
MTRTEVPVVRKQVVVNAPVEQAFTAFTERFGDMRCRLAAWPRLPSSAMESRRSSAIRSGVDGGSTFPR